MLYWMRRQTKFDFGRFGKEWYREHYGGLEEELRGSGREWLNWEVRDGWEPLCGFLGVEVPGKEFPNENSSGGFDKRRVEVHGKRMSRADAKMRMAAVVLAGAVVAAVGWCFLR